MNNTKNLKTDSTVDFANGEVVIQFRAECPADAEAIRSILWPWLLSVETKAEPMEYEGNRSRGVDMEAKMRLCPGAPSVEELRYILDAVPNAHIVADTLETAENYTGEREPRKAWTGAVKRPAKEILSVALNAVASRQKVLEVELERMQKAYRTLRAMHDLGTRWTPPVGEGSSAGWLLILEKPDTDLKRMVVVDAPSLADFRSPLKQEREVNKRMLVINS